MDLDEARWQRKEDDYDRVQGRLEQFRYDHGQPDPDTEGDWQREAQKEPQGDEELPDAPEQDNEEPPEQEDPLPF